MRRDPLTCLVHTGLATFMRRDGQRLKGVYGGGIVYALGKKWEVTVDTRHGRIRRR